MLFFAAAMKEKAETFSANVQGKLIAVIESYNARLKGLTAHSGKELLVSFDDFNTDTRKSLDSFLNLIFPLGYLLNLWLSFLYFFYVTIPVSILSSLWNIGVVVCCRRSFHARRLIVHLIAIFKIVRGLWDKIITTKLSDLISFGIQTFFEIASSMLSSKSGVEKNLSIAELSELLAYEELDIDDEDECRALDSTEKRMKSIMHRFVPSKPFRATVRLRKKSHSSWSETSGWSAGLAMEDYYTTQDDGNTPASFPTTPFSRAFVMSRSSERVDSVMFAARDSLRLQTQVYSQDLHSRRAAEEANHLKQFAIFDSNQCSDGLALSCGNHCVNKVGMAPCGSVRAMVPIRRGLHIYFEFSITVSGGQIPDVALGFCSMDHSLDQMVGTSPGSIAINSSGVVMSGASDPIENSHGELNLRRFLGFMSAGRGNSVVRGGSTVGFLVFLPSAAQSESDEYYDGECCHSSLFSSLSHPPAATLQINVNGKLVPSPHHVQRELAENSVFCDGSSSLALHPCVSLRSEDTRIWCRFNEGDAVCRSRGMIGAPADVRVYCLDGTLLIGENDY